MNEKEKFDRLKYLNQVGCVYPEGCLHKIQCQKEYRKLFKQPSPERLCLNHVIKHIDSLDLDNNLRNLIKNATENEETKFPDFTFNNGLLEHFKITASKETSKRGAEFQRAEAHKNYEVESKKRDLDVGESFEVKYNHDNHSYENLKNSLTRNFENHIESYRNYASVNEKAGYRIFLIENFESSLQMHINPYVDENGNYFQPQTFNYYSLKYDNEMLHYLSQFKDEVDYVLYAHISGVEVIELKSIKTSKIELDKLIVPTLFGVRIKGVKKLSEYELPCYYSLNNMEMREEKK